jgi:hypothetical protein
LKEIEIYTSATRLIVKGNPQIEIAFVTRSATFVPLASPPFACALLQAKA